MQEQQDKLNKVIEHLEEELIKGPNYWKDKDPKKYKAMLNRLKSQRKTPGHKERATQQVLQAKRRERGGSGSTTGNGHSKGKMKSSTGSAVKRFQSSEKKVGSKLSIDRKNNSKGYESGNTRNVPQHLNRGRHSVDEKKLKNWKKRLKKSCIDNDSFITYMIAGALNKGDEQLANALQICSLNRILEALSLKE